MKLLVFDDNYFQTISIPIFNRKGAPMSERSRPQPFPDPAELAARRNSARESMRDAGLLGIFILHSANMFYFTGTVQNGFFYLPADGEGTLFVRKSYEKARRDSPLEDIRRVNGLKELPGALAGRRNGIAGSFGLELGVLPAFLYFRFSELFPGARWSDCGPLLRKARSVKSSWEVAMIREAARQLGAMFDEVGGFLSEGISERELFADLERTLRIEGQQGLVRTHRWGADLYHGLVAAGSSVDSPTPFDGPTGSPGLYPGAIAGWSDRKIRRGEPVIIDMLGGYGGYHADQTRIFSVGEPPGELLEAHAFILGLQSKLEAEMKPGISPSSLYDMAIDEVGDAGYQDCFMNYGEKQVRFIGHGIGIELDELPVIAGRIDEPLEAGNVFALEPKIVFPGKGAVGIEDDYVITGDGFEKLTDFPGEIQVL